MNWVHPSWFLFKMLLTNELSLKTRFGESMLSSWCSSPDYSSSLPFLPNSFLLFAFIWWQPKISRIKSRIIPFIFYFLLFFSVAVLLPRWESIPYYPCLTEGNEGPEKETCLSPSKMILYGTRIKVSSRWREIGQTAAFSLRYRMDILETGHFRNRAF